MFFCWVNCPTWYDDTKWHLWPVKVVTDTPTELKVNIIMQSVRGAIPLQVTLTTDCHVFNWHLKALLLRRVFSFVNATLAVPCGRGGFLAWKSRRRFLPYWDWFSLSGDTREPVLILVDIESHYHIHVLSLTLGGEGYLSLAPHFNEIDSQYHVAPYLSCYCGANRFELVNCSSKPIVWTCE